jgi:hypothetical protein
MANLKYNPNMSGGTEGTHTESVKTASDQAENGVSESATKLCMYLLFVNPSVMLAFIFLPPPRMEDF